MSLRSWIHRLTAPQPANSALMGELRGGKLLCVVNRGLKMGKGKIAAQVGHAAVKAALNAAEHHPAQMQAWLSSGQRKVVVKAQDAEEIEKLLNAAKRKGLPTGMIHDAGRTQIPAGSLTVGSIGPDDSEAIDELTAHLKLL